jgi:hypothetical protein
MWQTQMAIQRQKKDGMVMSMLMQWPLVYVNSDGLIDPNFSKCTNILSRCHLFLSFLPSHFYHVKTHLWMIMMESIIVMV